LRICKVRHGALMVKVISVSVRGVGISVFGIRYGALMIKVAHMGLKAIK